MRKTLTARQLRFIEEYLVLPNATRAAILAGYSKKTARAIACETLQKPAVAEEINRRRQRDFDELRAYRIRLLEESARFAFSSLKGAIRSDGLKPPSEWPPDVWDAVEYVKYPLESDEKSAGSKRNRGQKHVVLKMRDKVPHLKFIGEASGLVAPGPGRRTKHKER